MKAKACERQHSFVAKGLLHFLPRLVSGPLQAPHQHMVAMTLYLAIVWVGWLALVVVFIVFPQALLSVAPAGSLGAPVIALVSRYCNSKRKADKSHTLLQVECRVQGLHLPRPQLSMEQENADMFTT